MNDTNERQATNACTHTDDGSVCAKCLGVESGGVDKMSEKPMEGDVIIKANTHVWCIFALTEDGEIESLGRLTDSVLRGDINISALERQMDALTVERDAALTRAEQAEAGAAILREVVLEFDADYARIMAEKGITERGVMGVHISDALNNTTAGADLLAELARLRKLEADAKAFCADYPTPPDDAMRVNDPEGYGYAVVAQALRAHLAESE